MTARGPDNRWQLTPGVLMGALGMIGAIAGAWMSFESRITKVEEAAQTLSKRFDRVEDKLDRLIEKRTEDER